MVNGWVKFLVALLVFKQVAAEASQFAFGGPLWPWALQGGLVYAGSNVNHRGEQFLDMLLEIAFTIHAVHLRFSQQRIYGMNAILYAQGKQHPGLQV